MFKFRRGQEQVFKELCSYLKEGKVIFFQAPAGYGKTVLTLLSLNNLMRDGIRVIWSVRTGNETDRPIEELKKIGLNLPALSFRGKRDMCLLAKEIRARTYEGVEALCRLRRERCPYYLALRGKPAKLLGPMTFTEIYEEGRREGVCPYYLQHRLLERAKLISLSYNYVFTPVMWSIRSKFPFKRAVLVVDEAHNLQNLAYSLNSDYISTFTISRAERELKKLGEGLDLNGLKLAIKSIERRMSFGEAAFSPKELLREAGLGERDLFKLLRLGEEVQRLKVEEGKEPRSSLHHLAEFLLSALEREGEEGIVFIAVKEGRRVKLEMRDLRASEFLKEVWPNFYRIILMSGTLRPIEAFSEIVGLSDYAKVIGEWSYNYAKIRSFIVEGVNTRGEELSRDMARRYIELIRVVSEKIPENVAVFTASYRILEDLKEGLDGLGREVFVEEKEMSGRKAAKILKEFKEADGRGLLLATCSGRFAEGADFPGRSLRAVVIAGVPYDRMTLSTKLYISYFKKMYGAKGRYYAYILPAMRRVNQALGRVIREEGEGGMFILADERFKSRTLFKLLPKYVRRTARRVGLGELGTILASAYRDIS